MSTDEWIKNTVAVYSVIFFSWKKEGNPATYNNVNLEGITLSEIRQIKKDKCYIASLTGGIIKKKKRPNS